MVPARGAECKSVFPASSANRKFHCHKSIHLAKFAILKKKKTPLYLKNQARTMPTECCVRGCLNRGGHSFPWSDKQRVKAWEIAIKTDHWKPTKHSVVSKAHFEV